jgi:tRNA-dihydrouridine synthase B
MFLNSYKLTPPVLILAPMDDITDSPFRRICKEHGADIVFTDFISVDGILQKDDHFGTKLNFLPQERPIGIQLFGNNPDTLKQAIQLIAPLRPDFIDLNFGCPVKKIVSKGSGAALLNNIPLMETLAKTAVNASNIPVTVKTRTGWDMNSRNILEIALRLEQTGIAAITIHGRTKAQMYSGEADWNIIAEVKHKSEIKIPVYGNGDITSAEKALYYHQQYQLDGLMIGRATFGNPFIFSQIKEILSRSDVSNIDIKKRIAICKKHLDMTIQWKGEHRTIFEIRKHYSNYFKGLANFKPFKQKLMLAKSQKEIIEILDEIETVFI